MRAVLLAVMLVGLAQASPTLAYTAPSTIAPELLAGATAPVALVAASADVSIGANATSARARMDPTPEGAAMDIAWLQSNLATPQRMRLALTAVEGPLAACDPCTLRLACGDTTSSQLEIAASGPSLTQGEWLAVDAVGGSCPTWTLSATARADAPPAEPLTLRYRLELAPQDESSPLARYVGMALTVGA